MDNKSLSEHSLNPYFVLQILKKSSDLNGSKAPQKDLCCHLLLRNDFFKLFNTIIANLIYSNIENATKAALEYKNLDIYFFLYARTFSIFDCKAYLFLYLLNRLILKREWK